MDKMKKITEIAITTLKLIVAVLLIWPDFMPEKKDLVFLGVFMILSAIFYKPRFL